LIELIVFYLFGGAAPEPPYILLREAPQDEAPEGCHRRLSTFGLALDDVQHTVDSQRHGVVATVAAHAPIDQRIKAI
jgi:hypothetical protein